MDEKKLLKRKSKALNSSNRKSLAEICNELGDYYYKKTDYEKALFEYKNSAKVYLELKMKLENAKLHRMIGEVYMFLVEFKKALKHNEIYLETVRELDNKIEEQRAFATLGRVYLLQGQSIDDDIPTQLCAFKSAEKSFMKSLKICESLKGKVSNTEFMDMKARLLLNIGVVSEQLGDFEKAIVFFQKSISICKSQDLYDLLTQCYITEGLLHSSKYNDHTKAISCFNMALNFANKLDNKISKQCEILYLKSEALCKLSDFQSAKMVLTKAWKMKSTSEEERQEIEKNLKIVAALCYTEDTIITTNSDDCDTLKKLYEKMGDGACLLKNYHKGIYFYLKMLDYAEKCGETGNQLVPIYVSLYQTYKDLKDYEKALEYNKKEYEIIKSEPKEAFKTLLNIAEIMSLSNKPYEEIATIYEEAREQALKMTDKKFVIKCLKLYLKVQENFSMSNEIDITKKEIGALEAEHQYSDDSSEDGCDGSETPNIGDDISLENLTDFSDDEDNDKNTHQTKRKRGKSFFIKKNNKGETQLHQACISGNTLLVSRLLSQGHPVNIRDNAGWLPIHEACIHGHKTVVELLIKSGAHVNDRGGNQCDGITPICDAAFNGHLDVIEVLLDNGASPVIKTDSGDNPLDILKKWRDNSSLDSSEIILYENLYSRMQKSLEKTGDATSNNYDMRGHDSVNTNKNSHASLNSTPNSYNSLINTEDQVGQRFSPNVSNKRNIIDDESDSSASDTDSFRSKSKMAVTEYKNAIRIFRKKSVQNNLKPNVNESKKIPAILSTTDIDEDWLENDLMPVNKKRRDLSTENLSSKKKSQSPLKSPIKSLTHPEQEPDTLSLDSCSSEDSLNAFQNSGDSTLTNSNNIDTNSSKRSRKFKNQVSLLRVGFSRKRSSQLSDWPTSISDENRRDRQQSTEEPDSTTDSNKSSFSNLLLSNTQSFVTDTIKAQAVKPPISVRIRIQEKTFLIPVPSEKVTSSSINWLIQEACRRFYNLEGIRPTLSLLTNDGALLSEDDPLSIILTSSELVANIINWNLPPLGERYVECCSQSKIDADNHIKHLLEKSQATNSADFINLNLEIEMVKPIFKALNHQTTLKSIVLANNSIGNEGVKLLCESLHTLSNIEDIDLSGNLIDANGVQYILTTFDKANHPICKNFHSLNLNYNYLSDLGFKYIIKLSQIVQFETLSLRNNYIEMMDIIEDVTCLRSLKNIDLSLNNFGKNALYKLFISLENSCLKNLQLEKLTIKDALISNEGIFSNLVELDLSRSDIKDSDVLQMLRISSKYDNLEKLSLRYNNEISYISFEQILLHETLIHVDLEGCSYILKNVVECDGKNSFAIGEKRKKMQCLKFSCDKNSEYYRHVNNLIIMWTNYWEDKSIIDKKLHGLIVFSKA